MKRRIDSISWPAEAVTLWPAITVGFFWVESRGFLDLFLFFVLIVSGGISYTYVARARNTELCEVSRMDASQTEINPLYLLSEGTLLDFIELRSPRAASALPQKTRSIFVVILSLSVVVLSFLWLWFRSSRYVLEEPVPKTAIVTLGILPYLFVGVLLVAFLWTGGESAVSD